MDYHQTDPEFTERFEHFAFDEVVNEPGQQLDDTTRYLAILATLLGCQGIEEFGAVLPRALDAGVTPVMVKETVYQAVDYLGIGRVRPFLDAVNAELTARGVALPLAGQATTTMADGWKRARRRRRLSSVRTCWRHGSRAISTAGWPPTALAITIRAPDSIWPSVN